MKEYKPNKIWGCVTTSKAIDALSSFPFFFANSDHILVISDEQPDGMVEMTEEYQKRFKDDDWMFVDSVLDKVRKEQIEKYHEEAEKLEQEHNEFLIRFRNELEAIRVGTGDSKNE